MSISQLLVMGGLIAATMVIIYYFPNLPGPFRLRFAAILVVATLVIFSGMHTKDGGRHVFDSRAFPNSICRRFRGMLPLCGSFCRTPSCSRRGPDRDASHAEPGGRYNRPRPAKPGMPGPGAANVVSGFFGAMGGCAMIGQTMINVGSAPEGDCPASQPHFFCSVSYFFARRSSSAFRSPRWSEFDCSCVREDFRMGPQGLRQDTENMTPWLLSQSPSDRVHEPGKRRDSGILIAALVFAWQHAKQLSVQTRMDEKGARCTH